MKSYKIVSVKEQLTTEAKSVEIQHIYKALKEYNKSIISLDDAVERIAHALRSDDEESIKDHIEAMETEDMIDKELSELANDIYHLF